ncbi:RNA polymerase sigma-70 factor [Paraflavisolibacter sp. H34]|uniref:RNA polymerase sigma-70 factor n=1 Tax=Huijunlia imazamoxiresistens TaxID=3127457 RepID=UPI003015ABDE
MAEAVVHKPVFHSLRMEESDRGLAELLARKDEAAFEQVFRAHYGPLHAYACSLLQDEWAAEEMVQNVFYKLWERADRLSLQGPLAAYLYRAVYNESLNHLKHRKVKAEHGLYVARQGAAASGPDSGQLKELQTRLHAAINELPDQCRLIFQLSRFEDLRYAEIARHLGLSVKTVENQMGKALKVLRTKLAEFLTLLFVFTHLNDHL